MKTAGAVQSWMKQQIKKAKGTLLANFIVRDSLIRLPFCKIQLNVILYCSKKPNCINTLINGRRITLTNYEALA